MNEPDWSNNCMQNNPLPSAPCNSPQKKPKLKNHHNCVLTVTANKKLRNVVISVWFRLWVLRLGADLINAVFKNGLFLC